MMSDEQLWDARNSALGEGFGCEVEQAEEYELAELRAVEAAVRADQIEKMNLDAHFECDCVPYDGPPHCHGCHEALGQITTWADRDCAAAIRAQLTERNGDVD